MYGRWIENGKAVEYFSGSLNAKEVTAKALTQYLHDFLGIWYSNSEIVRTIIGCDGASAMSGVKGQHTDKNEVPSPSALNVHSHCHQLLAAVYAGKEQ